MKLIEKTNPCRVFGFQYDLFFTSKNEKLKGIGNWKNVKDLGKLISQNKFCFQNLHPQE